MTKINRNLSTKESRDFWRHADASAQEVQAWPDWKRAGINVATERSAARLDGEKVQDEQQLDE